MGDFSTQWLRLREPADAKARAPGLVHLLDQWLQTHTAPGPIRILDLGCGNGSNLRWLAPRLHPGRDRTQHWICIDRDAALLYELAATPDHQVTPGSDCQRPNVETMGLDLHRGGSALPIAPGTLITASALLDLVGEAWLGDLLTIGRRTHSPMLFALTYDGRVAMEPAEPMDGAVIALVNAHQRRDKGLGPALGPSAPAYLTRLAGRLGLSVQTTESDWLLGDESGAMQRALVEGWTLAAAEQVAEAPGASPVVIRHWQARIDQWQEARLGHIAGGGSRINVGHRDQLVLPADRG